MKDKLSSLCAALEANKNHELSMIIGLDGFVDEILHVVDLRQDFNSYTRILSMDRLAERIGRAAGLSANIELVPVRSKLGGNGPIMANALLNCGVKLTYIGALGQPEIDPVFRDMAEKAERVYSLCPPAHTDALEFTDGKLQLGKLSAFNEITWERVKKVVGSPAEIAALINGCDLFGMENWTMIPAMSEVWQGLIDEVFPLLKTRGGGGVKPLAFFDLADPEKRTVEDISEAMRQIGMFEQKFRAILGLNEKELYQIARSFGVKYEDYKSRDRLRLTTLETYNKLGIYCLVVHPVRSACCCINGEYYEVEGPYCENPALTTGAGDEFNAGFCFGQALGLTPAQALTLGVCMSGFYVRNAKSPSYDELMAFALKWLEDGEI